MTKDEEMKIEMMFMRIGNEIYKLHQKIIRIENEFMRKHTDTDSQSQCVRALEDKAQTQQDTQLPNKASLAKIGPITGSMSSYSYQIGRRDNGL